MYHAKLSQPFVVGGIETLMVVYPKKFSIREFTRLNTPILRERIPASKKNEETYCGKVQGISASLGTKDGECRTCHID